MSQNGDTETKAEIPAQFVVRSLQAQVAEQALRIAMLEATLSYERGERPQESQ
jgi:hypothetical protein